MNGVSHNISPRSLIHSVLVKSHASLQNVLNTYTLPARWTVLNRGGHFLVIGDDANSNFVTLEYQAILDYASSFGWTLPSAGQQIEQNALVATLIDLGIWDELDVFYNFLTDGDSSFAKINWINPGTFTADGTGHEPAFTANSGFKGDGTVGKYLSTTWRPATNGVNFILSDACMFVGAVDNDPLFAASALAGVTATVPSVHQVNIQYVASGTTIRGGVNVAGGSTLLNTNFASQTFFHQRRQNGPSTLFIDGVSFGASAEVGIQLNVDPIFILARNFAAGTVDSPAKSTVQVFGAGASLAGLELALYQAWTKYKATAAYARIIAYATAQAFTLPTVEQQVVQEQLIEDLMLAGIWDKLDVFYNFYTNGNNGFAKINWKAPGTFQAVGTGHEPTFTANGGFKGNGTSQYLDTTFIPSAGVSFLLNDASFGCDSGGEDVVNDAIVMGGFTTNTILLRRLIAGGGGNFSVNAFGAVATPAAGAGFYHCQRSSSTTTNRFKNGVQDATSGAFTSVAAPTASIFICAHRNGGTPAFFSTDTVRMAWLGASLAGLELALYNAWQTYKTNA